MPGRPRPTDPFRVAVATLAALDPWRFDLEADAVVATAMRCRRGMVAALGEGGLWSAIANDPAAPEQPDVLRTALVLLADHGLAASTMAARVAASARAHPYAVVSAGLGALDGPVHGTASTAAHRFLAEALDDPEAAVAERLRAGERLPGFGHSIYAERDPRTAVLLELIPGTEAAALVERLTAAAWGGPACSRTSTSRSRPCSTPTGCAPRPGRRCSPWRAPSGGSRTRSSSTPTRVCGSGWRAHM